MRNRKFPGNDVGIDEAQARDDSLGGVFQVQARGVPAGVGSVMHWDRRLDGRLAQALMSIPGIKAVEIGYGRWQSRALGSQAHDQWQVTEAGPQRQTNWAGGLEGGMSNGEEIDVICCMKPIPSIVQPLQSFHWQTHAPAVAARERADACAVPAASIVGEAMMAIVLWGRWRSNWVATAGSRWSSVWKSCGAMTFLSVKGLLY